LMYWSEEFGIRYQRKSRDAKRGLSCCNGKLKMIYSRQDEFVNSLIRLASVNTTGRIDWELVAQQHLHNMSDQLICGVREILLDEQ
ncbi:hypothetical protein OSTOST_24894, partial [Ostertagia ostertagi]